MPESLRILVVDDDPDILLGAARALAKGNYATATAATGEEALAVLPAFRPDLVLLDRDLPGLDGVEVCRRIKESPSTAEVFVVLISGTYTGSDEQAEGLESGADGYIVRPLGNRELRARMAAFVRILKLTRSLNKERQKFQEKSRALQKSEERFRATFEQATVGMAHVAADGRWLRVNQKLCDILGYSREELSQRTHQDLIHPDDLSADGDRLRRLPAGDLRTCTTEQRYLRKDGSPVWVNVTTSLIREPSESENYFLIVVEDISERRRALEELIETRAILQAAMDHSQAGIAIADAPDGRLRYVNRAGLMIRGKTEEEVVRDVDIRKYVESWRILHFDGTPYAPEEVPLARAVLHGEVCTEEFIIRRSESEDVVVWANAAPIRDASGKVIAGIVLFLDITDRKQAETERELLQRQLLQVQKMEAIGTLAGGIAHDFNNILGAILGYSELALDRLPPGSELASDLKEVLRAGERARELVKQILAFSRKGEQTRQLLQTHLVVGEALRLLRQTIPSSIPIRQTVSKRDDRVLADPTQLHQVVMNLCTNAYHALRNQGGTLSVGLEPVEVDVALAATIPDLKMGPHVRLTVVDTGTGMDPLTLSRACEPFFTTKPQGEGTGMGLAVVHGIVRRHEGAIQIESQLGAGTRVHVYLPRHQGDAASEAAQKSAATLPGGTERILVVDDEPVLARMTAKMLTSLGYRVESVSTSAAALEVFRSAPDTFDLVLTDQTMPGMTGDVLVRKMLEIRPDLPVLICTGYSESLDEDRALAVGAQGLLPKPLERAALAKLVREVLDTAGGAKR